MSVQYSTWLRCVRRRQLGIYKTFNCFAATLGEATTLMTWFCVLLASSLHSFFFFSNCVFSALLCNLWWYTWVSPVGRLSVRIYIIIIVTKIVSLYLRSGKFLYFVTRFLCLHLVCGSSLWVDILAGSFLFVKGRVWWNNMYNFSEELFFFCWLHGYQYEDLKWAVWSKWTLNVCLV